MSGAVDRRDDGGKFINLWELFAQIGKAEAIYGYEAAREFASCLSNDPIGMNFIRRRDELGILCPIDIDTRLRLLQLLNLFGSQGTLFDEDGIPNDDAQPTFERFGFYASDIYPFLARHDVAISRPGDDDAVIRVFPDGRRIPGWILAYVGQAWIPYGRAVGILTASTVAAERHSPDHDDVFDRWDKALSDAVERGAIGETTVSGKRLLAHADASAWFAQQGHAWPLEAPEAQPDNGVNALPLGPQVQRAQSLSGQAGEHDGGMTRREQQIRAIEAMADREKYPRQQIPDGGKTKLRDLCKAEHAALFGAGDSPFDDAWKAASKADRIAMANRNKFAAR